ncbi:MAG: 5'-nucleotidase C-terminal domain-containing protein [Desulfobacterales bacterium]|nr:5'-nucleotidase C-terminal domain-containing protein [Desulfobacterales bacterium]
MKKYLLFFLIIFSLIISGCATAPLYQKDVESQLTILHTNDHHGHFWKNRHGEIGFAAQKTLVNQIRKEVKSAGGHVLLLSAGDINTGMPESDLLDAEPDFKAMSAIGYDAMALGNHEFDNPLDVLMKQKQWATFPFLSANTVKKGTGKPLFDVFKIWDFDGLKVAVIGFTTADTPQLTIATNVETLEFKDPVEVAKSMVPKLRKKAAVVIALAHMGYYENAQYGSNAPGMVTLARAVPGIDVIVGGHSHSKIAEPVVQNGTLIVQAGDNGKYVGRLDLTFKNGVVSMQSNRLIPVNLKKKVTKSGKKVRVFIEEEIKEDPEILGLLTPFYEQGQSELTKVIGSTTDVFVGERKIVRSQETNLGNLIARTQRLKVGADVAIMNSGGIRTSIAKGDITYKDVLKVQPFSNSIGLVTLTGKELKKYCEIAANKTTGIRGLCTA